MGRTRRLRRRKAIDCRPLPLEASLCFVELTKWMKQHNWNPAGKLFPAEFAETGRGLMTKDYIQDGDVLVSVPYKLIITVTTVASSYIGTAFKQNEVKFSAQQVLSVYLMWEHHLDSVSFWYPYLCTLPSVYTTPHFCSSEEIAVMPKFLLESILAQRQMLKDDFKYLMGVMNSSVSCCFHCNQHLKEIFTIEDYIWAWFTVNTRCVYLNDDRDCGINLNDKNCLALVPYLDMFNHSYKAKVQAGLNSLNDCFEIKTLVPFPKYSQVFIHYGNHSNLKLCIEYGFVIPCNPNDVIEFSFEEIMNSVKQNYSSEFNCSVGKLTYLKSHSLNKNLSCSHDGLSFNAKAVIYILITQDNDFSSISNKIYSGNFLQEECTALSKVECAVIEDKSVVLSKIITKMEEKSHAHTKSFEVTVDLISEYKRILHKAASRYLKHCDCQSHNK